MSSYILGLSFGYHDSAAAIVSEAGIIAAAHEERFSRIKNDSGFPFQAIEFCLRQAGIDASDIDSIVYYEDAFQKFDRICRSALDTGANGLSMLVDCTEDWLRYNKFHPEKLIQQHLKVDSAKISSISHHLSHASSAFLVSPFRHAAVLTIDGVGEKETLTISQGNGTELVKLGSVEFPDSIGLFYSAFTAYLGFEVNEGEYKVMGMAGFGEPRFYKQIRDIISLNGICRFSLDQSFFNFATASDVPFTHRLVDLLGPARAPESPFSLDGRHPIDATAQRYADIAASVQLCAEEILLALAKQSLEVAESNNICLAGGVALNSAANGRIRRELNCELFVQPSAGDAGNALGAATWGFAKKTGRRLPALKNPYLGADFSIAQIIHTLEGEGVGDFEIFDDEDTLLSEVARLLERGQVIGWLQGRAEWGPRALGNRSILAHPGRSDMKQIVNEKIKFREPFRPFAPSVLVERAEQFFELPVEAFHESSPESFMLAVCPVKESAKSKVPTITHVDGSARIHLVRESVNPLYYRLIQRFESLTNLPMLMNTSFNLRGEPVVNSPADALRTFQWSNMDALVLGKCLVKKNSNEKDRNPVA